MYGLVDVLGVLGGSGEIECVVGVKFYGLVFVWGEVIFIVDDVVVFGLFDLLVEVFWGVFLDVGYVVVVGEWVVGCGMG